MKLMIDHSFYKINDRIIRVKVDKWKMTVDHVISLIKNVTSVVSVNVAASDGVTR